MEEKNKIKIIGKILGFIILILFIFSTYKFLNVSGWFNSKMVEYPVMCKEKVISNHCEKSEYTLAKTTYKILKSRQEVLYWDEVDNRPSRLTKCAIENKRNWSCKYNDESAEFGFTNGEYWNYSLVPSVGDELWENVYYPSRTEYLMVQCENNIFCLLFENLF